METLSEYVFVYSIPVLLALLLTYLYFFPLAKFVHYLWEKKQDRLGNIVNLRAYEKAMVIHGMNSAFFILATVFILSSMETGGASFVFLPVTMLIQYILIRIAEGKIGRAIRPLEEPG